MINPFQYGGVVGRESFCNRKRELSDLKRAMENGERLFVYSERRMGKTSLIKRALASLPGKQFLGAYVDLWPTDGEATFSVALARAITESLAGTADRMLEAAKRLFGQLTPTITTDGTGNPQISFSVQRTRTNLPDLGNILRSPAEIAKRRNRRVVVVFDEFQRILEYGSDATERALRSAVQDQDGVSFIFLGSRKHLIQRMFLDQDRPLYRAGGHYPLGPIELKAWLPFVRARFRKTDKNISAGFVRDLFDITGGHPFYTQHLCHAVWELCEPRSEVSRETLDSAIRLLLERESHAYTALWETLAVNQRRFLVGLASVEEGVGVFAAEFLRRSNLQTPSSVQRVVENLIERDIIDREGGTYFISDRFFRLWIQKTSGI